jgi:hypothetical protein
MESGCVNAPNNALVVGLVGGKTAADVFLAKETVTVVAGGATVADGTVLAGGALGIQATYGAVVVVGMPVLAPVTFNREKPDPFERPVTVMGTGRNPENNTDRNARRPARYRHYGYEADSAKFLKGLNPGSYATTAEGAVMSGSTAQQVLALPHELPPDVYYEVIVPNSVPVIGPRPVERTDVPPRTGGGVEYIFPQGTPPWSVRGPFPLPPN